jgi:hypothetical protein
MSLDNIILPAAVVAGLYRKNLYMIQEAGGAATPVTGAVKPAESPAAPTFLGGNKKNVLVAVNDPDAVHIETGRLEVITKILSACKLTLEDVAIYNTAGRQTGWATLRQQLQPRFCLLFDIAPDVIGLPVVFPHYHQHQHDGCMFLLSNSIDEINRDNLLKSKLWLCLKSIFKV